jgi:hypothetical protein
MKYNTEPMNEFITWGLTTLVGAFVGSFLAGYLKKKAENLATHEDIGKLVDQVKAVTITTEEIKTQIKSDLWDSQKRWETRREVILESLRNVGRAQSILMDSIVSLGRSDDARTEEDKSAASVLATHIVKRCKRAMQSLSESLTVVALVSGKSVVTAFASVNDAFTDATSAFGKDRESRNKAFANFARAVTALQLAVRKELKIPAE